MPSLINHQPTKGVLLAAILWLFIGPSIEADAQSTTEQSAEAEPGVSSDSGNQGCNLVDLSCQSNAVGVAEAPNGVEPRSAVGNPINLMDGNKTQSEIDLSIPGAKLTFRRVYNSINSDANVGLGQGWHHSYAVSLFDAGNGVREIVQSNGARIRFISDGTDDSGNPFFLGTKQNFGYLIFKDERHYWHLPDGRTLSFNGSFLVNINWPDQTELSLYYRYQRLHSVTDETGRVLVLNYSQGGGAGRLNSYETKRFETAPGHLNSVILPDGSEIRYEYDNRRNLTRVTYPDESATEYHYEDEDFSNHLTGMTDRHGVRFATWAYDDYGRATLSEHAQGVERVTLRYPDAKLSASGAEVQTTVTNSQGFDSIFTWQTAKSTGQPQLLSSTGAGCATCPPMGYDYTYDERGRLVTSTSHGQGSNTLPGVTDYQYDDKGRITDIHHTDAADVRRLVERREYEGVSLLPVRVSSPSINNGELKSIEFTFNNEQLPVAVTETGFAPVVERPESERVTSAQLQSIIDGTITYKPVQRTSTLAWEAGKLVSVDGPRTDVDDITTFQWDERDRLVGVQPPESPVFSVISHDAMGRPTQVQWGLRTPIEIVYDSNGYLKESRQGRNVVSFSHDVTGRLISITDQYNRTRSIAYDDAGRRVSTTDDIGNTLLNTYDSESRLTRQARRHNDGTMVRVLSYLFDETGEVYRTVDETTGALPATSQVMDLYSDPVTHDRSITDAQSGVGVTLAMDIANQVLRYTDANNAVTQMHLAADGLPSLTTDANGNSTMSLRDDFGRQLVQASTDAGWIEYGYDAAGNRVESALANGINVRFQFDAANRQIMRDDTQTVTQWIWNKSTGMLAEARNPASTDRYEYDNDARLTSHARVLDGREFVTRYTYDEAGRVSLKYLPDGQVLRHHYHNSGPNRGTLRAISRQTLLGLAEQTLLTQIDLEARDGSVGYLSANGMRTEQTMDRLGRVTHLDIGGKLALNYTFDSAGRIISVDNNGSDQRYTYSGGRLSAASTVLGNFAYRYDALGNRTGKQSQSIDGQREDVSYQLPESGEGNRLIAHSDAIDGAQVSHEYNPAGAPTQVGELRYEYDTLNRPIKVYRQDQLLANYQYNAFGERVKKTVYSSTGTPRITYFLYDGSSLTAEVDEQGTVQSQYVYIEGIRPVAQLRGKAFHTIHSDHQGTPRMMSDEEGKIVWQAEYTPFGKATLLVAEQSLNLRFAGQYEDAETGTHYNYLRDYNPDTGRYLTSDPMGLLAGLNTYSYVANNPLSSIDPLGLFVDTTTVTTAARIGGWLVALGGSAVAAVAGTVTAPVWIAGGVVVGITAAAVAVYYYNGYDGDETEFANDFGPPPQSEFQDLRDQLAEYDINLASQANWDGTWDTLLELQQTLLDAQHSFVQQMNDILSQNPGNICLSPPNQELYDRALEALRLAGLGSSAAQESMDFSDGQEQPDLTEMAYEDYRANGGTLTRADWEIEGQPVNAHSGADFSQVPTINGRRPINSRYAGGRYPHDRLPESLQVLYPSSVEFTAQGFPKFGPFSIRTIQVDGMTGDYPHDEALALAEANMLSTPPNYVWHHVEDGTTLMLVPKDIHNAVKHTGGAAFIRNGRRFD